MSAPLPTNSEANALLREDQQRRRPLYRCRSCGREESACSADPCPAVIADRGE